MTGTDPGAVARVFSGGGNGSVRLRFMTRCWGGERGVNEGEGQIRDVDVLAMGASTRGSCCGL